MKKALVTLILVSTGSFASQTKWQDPNALYDSRHNFTNRTTVIFKPVDDVRSACEVESRKRGRGGFGYALEACSFWEGNTCTVVIQKKFTINTLGHEMLHCLQGNYHD